VYSQTAINLVCLLFCLFNDRSSLLLFLKERKIKGRLLMSGENLLDVLLSGEECSALSVKRIWYLASDFRELRSNK